MGHAERTIIAMRLWQIHLRLRMSRFRVKVLGFIVVRNSQRSVRGIGQCQYSHEAMGEQLC